MIKPEYINPDGSLSIDFIRNIVRTQHANYALTVEIAEKLKVHSEGRVPEKLINDRRPNEPEEIKKYRRKIYVPKTQHTIGKVMTSLQKIRRSQDWNISYPETPATITAEESLENYCEKSYPVLSSLTNFTFSELLKQYLVDPNAFYAAIVQEPASDTNAYVKPEIMVFPSKRVVNIAEGEYVVLMSADKNVYKSPGGRRTYQGDIYYILTDTLIICYKQASNSGDLTLAYAYSHNLGYIPAGRVGGLFYKRLNNDTLYRSRIADMVPSLDEAAREYSDLQAEIVQHIHSEKYIYTNTECPSCKGTGVMPDEANGSKPCTHCGGVGSVKSVSPYGEYLLNVGRFGVDQVMPSPPIGYIQKDTTIAKLQDERVKQHLYDALSAINMEFLAETPLAQSGTAKVVDRDELNNFVNSIAEDLVRMLDNQVKWICDLRYSVLIPDAQERHKMLPSIQVPEQFDLLNSQYLMTEIQTATTAQVSPVLRKFMELEYARKKYNYDPAKAEELETVYELDPLYGYTNDEKMTIKAAGGITEQDYVLSCNIRQFVQRAMLEKDDFLKTPFAVKKQTVEAYAKEVIDANSATTTIINNLQQ